VVHCFRQRAGLHHLLTLLTLLQKARLSPRLLRVSRPRGQGPVVSRLQGTAADSVDA
jgi:hypothetical protein